jgi:hypothetical protein
MIIFGVSSTPELLKEGSRVEDCAQHRLICAAAANTV